LKQIIADLRNHIKTDFELKSYGAIFLFLIVLITINYGFGIESNLLAKLSSFQYLVYFFVLYPFVFYAAVFIKSGSVVFKRNFIVISGLYMAILAVSSGLIYYREWTLGFPIFEQFYLRNIISNAQGVIIVFLPLTLIYFFSERSHLGNFYGLSLRNHNFKPYVFLLLFMVPLIAVATQLPGFLETYPTMKIWHYQSVFGLSTDQMLAIYETVYLSDFIRVETIFRGALVIGMVRFLGKDSIIIMATLYCVLHFNKPLGETISSFFGGYLLGTIAYYQKNIVGGCLVHAGIAGLMELFAYIVHTT